jgi:DNA-binding CsgD family transcriptional regulator
MGADFPEIRMFWKYAKLRTNFVRIFLHAAAIFLKSNEIDPMSQPDPRTLSALASLDLTPREAEVLFWVSEGKSNHDISVILGASVGTICKHVENILSKLNVENRTAAALLAFEKRHFITPLRSRRKWARSHATILALLVEQLLRTLSDGCEIYDAIADSMV